MSLEFFGGPLDGERKPVAVELRRMVIPQPMPPELVSPAEQESLGPTLREMFVHVYEKKAYKLGNAGPVQLRMIYVGEMKR